MMQVRSARDRGVTQTSWLDSRHSFSFGEYYDPRHMAFGPLRVINEDKVLGGGGFAPHSHRDMEIISVVLSGSLAHRDSLGENAIIRPGDLQRMTAGTGVTHSEYNGSGADPVHFLQIWILPEAPGLAPSYEQRSFAEAEKRGRLRLVGARDGREGAVRIHQDAEIHAGLFAKGEATLLALRPGRGAWVQIARGEALINGVRLGPGDGAALKDEAELRIEGLEDAELLVFDVAA